MKKVVGISLAAALATTLSAQSEFETLKSELEAVKQELEAVKKAQKKSIKKTKKLSSKVSDIKRATGGDNVKFSIDFRNAMDVLDYEEHDSGQSASNPSLLTSRLYLGMAAAPADNLTFMGKLAIYSVWGAHVFGEDAGLKDWSASSKMTDTVMRVKEAYFVYKNAIGEQPVTFSIGRRPSTNGYLANYRENEDNAGSPLAHITNMEVNAAMVKLSWDRFVQGAYTKFVYGRAHTGETTGVYSIGHSAPWGPNAELDTNDRNVDFFVMPGVAYGNGQYEIMYEWAHIFNTKGQQYNDPTTKKDAAGTADLYSIGFKADGIGEEISDFLDNTVAFVSAAYSHYDAKDGYQLLGSSDGGTRDGSSIWLGVVMPDMLTESGKFGFEYNHGSKYWTPMTWAEDTAIGSKIAVRGDAFEAYWNFDLFGVEYLPSQIRYTYAQHDYTPNVNCAGWVASNPVDITAQDLRFAVTYTY